VEVVVVFNDWDDRMDEGTTGRLNYGIFDVGKAKKLLKANPKQEKDLDVTGYGALARLVEGVNSNSRSVDLSVPLIMVPIQNGALPIDGWGRIARAIAEGRPTLSAVALTRGEKKQVQLGPSLSRSELRGLLGKHGLEQKEGAVADLLGDLGWVVRDS
jgi:hypothetical protein